jgi:hypothetical protein
MELPVKGMKSDESPERKMGREREEWPVREMELLTHMPLLEE